MQTIGLVVPTLFTRLDYLARTIQSIKQEPASYLLLTSPLPFSDAETLLEGIGVAHLIDGYFVENPAFTLPEKITAAMSQLPDSCQHVGWLGDDDILIPDGLASTARVLDEDSDVVLVFGGCDYITAEAETLFTNKSSQFAARLLRFGPQLIPQPGALWRRSAFEKVGGLSNEFDMAFDFDLFLKLSKIGKLKHIDQTLAQFRWHPDSLSVKRRWRSVTEASRVRRKHYSGLMRYMWVVWEPWVILTTWLAGKLVGLRVKSQRNSEDVAAAK